MATLFRNVTSHFTNGSGRAADVQLAQEIERFENERKKLSKFQREYRKYTDAFLLFDNASQRFFDEVQSLGSSTWNENTALIQSSLDLNRIRGDYLRNLNAHMVANLKAISEDFDNTHVRIAEQSRRENEYDKTRRRLQSSLRTDDAAKIDKLRNDVDQLRSSLNLINDQLRDELSTFHQELRSTYTNTIVQFFNLHGRYHKDFYKTCLSFVKNTRRSKNSTPQKHNDDESPEEIQPINKTSEKSTVHQHESPKVQHPQKYKIIGVVEVTHDYKAQNADELNLVEGESIHLIAFENTELNECDEGWKNGKKSDGTVGVFPVNFTTTIYANEKVDRM